MALFKAITSELGISIGTVKTHILRIYKKLHVISRSEAIVKFLGFHGGIAKQHSAGNCHRGRIVTLVAWCDGFLYHLHVKTRGLTESRGKPVHLW
jgi:hypothetical protein